MRISYGTYHSYAYSTYHTRTVRTMHRIAIAYPTELHITLCPGGLAAGGGHFALDGAPATGTFIKISKYSNRIFPLIQH